MYYNGFSPSFFADRLKEKMIVARETDEEAAKILGITEERMAELLAATALPTSRELFAIARRYKVSADYLISLVDEEAGHHTMLSIYGDALDTLWEIRQTMAKIERKVSADLAKNARERIAEDEWRMEALRR